jgi:hypothetical protein
MKKVAASLWICEHRQRQMENFSLDTRHKSGIGKVYIVKDGYSHRCNAVVLFFLEYKETNNRENILLTFRIEMLFPSLMRIAVLNRPIRSIPIHRPVNVIPQQINKTQFQIQIQKKRKKRKIATSDIFGDGKRHDLTQYGRHKQLVHRQRR